ncbi:MAG TPA: hydantoinase/oxoprolinase family protein, partial [Anaerolineae bacterium]|nr:hydantoinase/oxoprolinase family protein [Anaerolineae bacterium]
SLDPAEVAALAGRLQKTSVESIAVCFLFSFLHPDHERLVQRTISNYQSPQLPGAGGERQSHPFISLSCEVLPEYREYERASTTTINAYVAPLIARYLGRLEAALGGRRLRIMQSNGGVISAATAASLAARTVLSGPAGGIVGAFDAAKRAGFSRAITFDMGGTSTDVALCDGSLPTTTEGEIAGLPMRLPILDIHTVGAGGGSIARVDAGGALIVGPESAGAEPGPVCYGRGGTQLTVTDANLVLGRLDADRFLGGQMKLDMGAAQHAIAELAHASRITHHASLAWGVVRVANAAMERAIRKISVERGFDPRPFTLVAFGGAGPLHACELADSLGIARVLIPPSPGVLSALGMATADTVKDYSRAVLRKADAVEDSELDSLLAEMESRGREELLAEGVTPQDIVVQRALDLRYVGQSYEITVEEKPRFSLPRSASGAFGKRGFLHAFHQLHAARYSHSHPGRPVEIVTARVKAIGLARPIEVAPESPAGEDATLAIVGAKPVWFEKGLVETTLYERERLRAGHRVGGPAVVFQLDTTTVIPPGWSARVDQWRNLIVMRDE